MIRVALVGCGLISEAHIRGYAMHSDRAAITTVFDLDPSKALDKAALIPGCRVAASYDEVISDPSVDAIELCTPPHHHPSACMEAARAGKHVSCQKPLARTLAECDEMIAVAASCGTIIYYGEVMRTSVATRFVASAVAEGRIGQLVGIQGTYAHWQGNEYLGTAWRYDPRISGGGQLLDGGIHAIDQISAIGGPVEAVTCFTNRIRPELGGEDSAVVGLRFAGGYLGTLMATQAAGTHFPGPGLSVFGTRGILTVGGPYGVVALHADGLPDRREVLVSEWKDGFGEMIGAFISAVEGGEVLSRAEYGREDLRIVLAAYRAAELGREVRLPEMEA